MLLLLVNLSPYLQNWHLSVRPDCDRSHFNMMNLLQIKLYAMSVITKESKQVDKVPTKMTFASYDWLLIDMLCCDWL